MQTGSNFLSFLSTRTFGPLPDPRGVPRLKSGRVLSGAAELGVAHYQASTDEASFEVGEANVTNGHRPIPVLLALAIALGGVLGYWRAPVPRGLLIDVLGIAVLAGASTWVLRGHGPKWARRLVWGATGALTVAAIGSAAWMPPWIVLVVLCFLVESIRQRPTERRPALMRALGLVLSGALLNIYVLGTLVTQTPLSADPAAFRALDLRVHDFLADVPLRDVWTVHLPGGGDGRNILDVRELPAGSPNQGAIILLPAALVAVRLGVGWVLRWDTERAADSRSSYAHRLTPADRERCLGECPGNRAGEFGFRLLYTFHREMIYEVQNRTAHAFVTMAMVPATDGYKLFVAIYVKRTNWFTPVYMATIDPFRRLVMYPNALRSIERRWRAKWSPQGIPQS